jgi:hypothetical protein
MVWSQGALKLTFHILLIGLYGSLVFIFILPVIAVFVLLILFDASQIKQNKTLILAKIFIINKDKSFFI